MPPTDGKGVPLEFTSKIVTAYVSSNTVPTSGLPGLIEIVHSALDSTQERPVQASKPAVPPSRSVTPNHIVCLEDGKKLKILKRHLRVAHDLSPEEYCKKWELPEDYPIVAPKYSKLRSGIAQKSGLGRKPDKDSKGRKQATG